MPLITLTTDFGLQDHYVGAMKGVILRLAPDATVVDVTHLIRPQAVREAAVLIERVTPYFAAGAVHVVVVDPGVGTARRPLAARLGAQWFVGPDNGVVSYWLRRVQQSGQPIEFVTLDQPRYWLPDVSHSFHGRDIFAPVAAHLAAGVPLVALGSPITDPVLLPRAAPRHTAAGLQGEVIHIDHFGNLATNIRREELAEWSDVRVHVRDVEIRGLSRTFGERAAGELIVYFNSSGELEIALVNGSARERLGALVGDEVTIVLSAQ